MNEIDWNQPESYYTVVIRPALPIDKPDMLELTKTIWDGEDYVPHVWDEWMADPKGILLAAEYGGHVVGVSKLSQFAENDWWMHGLRVHPEHEGQKIASRLHDYQLAYWQEHGQGCLRLSTTSYRRPVHHLCERTGFRKVGEFTYFTADPLEGNMNNFQQVGEEAVEQALEFVLRSPSLELSWGFIDFGWIWRPPNRTELQECIQNGSAWWWRKDGAKKQGLLIVMEDEEDQERRPMVQAAACRVEVLPDMLLDYRRLAPALGYNVAAWVAPLRPEMEPILQAAGFQRDWEDSVFLFEKEHPRRNMV